jgi:hypothetical protein
MILRNVCGGTFVMEMKVMGSFEPAGSGLLDVKMKTLVSFETSGQALFDPEDEGTGIVRNVVTRTA